VIATEGCFYFCLEQVGQNDVCKKTAFLRASLARTAEKSRGNRLFSVLLAPIFCQKKKKVCSFCLVIFPRPPRVVLGFVFLSVVISVKMLKNNLKKNDVLLDSLSASRRARPVDVLLVNLDFKWYVF
jgi:hypothetical protein